MWEIKKVVKKGEYLYAVVLNHPRATKNNYVLHHRVVMENSLGRLLTKEEVVHHLNGNKHDNRIENLEVMTAKEHSLLHSSRGRHMTKVICAFCQKQFERETRQLKGKGLCSRRCNALFNRHLGTWNGRK